jgi:hypothetical protein
MIVATVLRSGGDFTLDHAHALDRMLAEYLPGAKRVCLSDMDGAPNRMPLEHGWPGWWAKLELCRPDITGPLLYLDLDTVIVGDLAPLVEDVSTSIVLRDLFRGRRKANALQSAMMLLTEADRALVWQAFTSDLQRWMRRRSDQDVYEHVLRDRVRYFQDTHPGMVVGFKSGLGRGKKRPDASARVVIFHGRPRPWASGTEWAEEPFRACTSVA